MSVQEEILDILKHKVLPAFQQMKQWRAEMMAEFRVMHSHLDSIEKTLDRITRPVEPLNRSFDFVDKRLDQMDQRIQDLHADMREMRSYVFTSKVQETAYRVREKSKS